jgi:cullin-associated NEDD8-dissociated protein 1
MIAKLMSSYSDDEDESWKIRRAAAKLLNAVIGVRNNLLVEFYQSVVPVLLARFDEREESVRLEVLAAFETLLKQTAVSRQAEQSTRGRNKRKWADGQVMEMTPDPDRLVILFEQCSRVDVTQSR